jgi:hypothetical protein
MTSNVEFKRTHAGFFHVVQDGQPTNLTIFNGSLGLSGSGKNIYGIERDDTITWIGSLAKAKKTAAFWLRKA